MPREHLGMGVAEYVVAVKEKLMHSDVPMDKTDGALVVHRSASSSGAQQPQEAQPQGPLRVLEREMFGEKDLETSLETMAEKI